jgi:hypothetical protein
MNIFEKYVIDNQLIVSEDAWSKLVVKYDQEKIIKEISDAIQLFKIELPYREISLDDAKADYKALEILNAIDLIKDGDWYNKFEYEYNFIPKYIDLSNVGNKASDYFHQVERWKCDATGYPSPQKTWDTERFRLTLFKALFSLKVKEINPQVLRNIISLRKYIASQFRPSAAKAIYDYFGAERVLDFSMGWGDRLAGAYASDSVKRYVGYDPNINLVEGYINEMKLFQTLSNKKFSVSIRPQCAEDENVVDNELFDLIFTSPPYFDKEKYDQSIMQSYVKYKRFGDWMEKFLFKTIELRSKNLVKGGYLVINISDIYTRKKLYMICDTMNDYIASTGDYEYVGAMGLRMPKRPMSKSAQKAGVNGEPIWIWKKKTKHSIWK